MNPFHPSLLRELARRHGTPLWVYDAATVRARIAALRLFDVVRYAQKANANVHLLRLMREQGVRVDAVSLGEIERAHAAGYRAGGAAGDEIVFTADLLDAATLDRVVRERIPVNAGSVDMLHQLGPRSPGHRVWLRINPGFGHGHSNKTNTGGERHVRPRRPRPAVCVSATTSVPWAAPSAARERASSLVLSVAART